MSEKIVIPIKKKQPAPTVVVGGFEFTLRMSITDIMAESARLMQEAGQNQKLAKEYDTKFKKRGGSPKVLTDEENNSVIEMARLTKETYNAPKELLDRMLGDGAHAKIAQGTVYSLEDDLEILYQITEAISNHFANQRRTAHEAPEIKKGKSRK